MKTKHVRRGNTPEVHRHAKEFASGDSLQLLNKLQALSTEEMRQTLRELHLKQIELVIQNDKLRRVQVELITAQKRYVDLYYLAPIGYCSISELGIITESNLTAAMLLGVNHDEMIGQPVLRFILNEDRDIYQQHLKKLFATFMPQTCELRMRKMDEMPIWTHIEAVVVQDEKGERVCRAVISDISQLKQVEESLRESENKYRLLVESSLFPVVVDSLEDNRILFANDLAQQYIGLLPETTLGLLAPELWCDPVDRERFIAKVTAGESVIARETRLRTCTGEEKTVLISMARVEFDKIPAALSILADISEHKQAMLEQESLANQVEQAQQRMKVLSKLLLDSHEQERKRISRELHDEIGQLLTAMKINLRSLISNTGTEGWVSEYIVRLKDQESLIDTTIQQVRRIASELRPPVLDDLGLLPAIRWYLDHHVIQNNIQATLTDQSLPERLAPAIENTCYRVLQEAVTNVLRHAKATHVNVFIGCESEYLRLVIHDNGLGFAVEETRSRAARGESFGLLSMQERVELIGGSLHISSSMHQGTAVTALLPLMLLAESLILKEQ
jgi:PAS domain S-box-containing protein